MYEYMLGEEREREFKKGARGQSFMGQKKVLRIVKDFKMHQFLVIVFFYLF